MVNYFWPGTEIVPKATSALSDSLTLSLDGAVLLCAVQVTASVSGYLMLLDMASKPPDGPVTPVKVWFASTTDNKVISDRFDPPIRMNNGGILVFSTTGPFTLTASATAFISAEVADAS